MIDRPIQPSIQTSTESAINVGQGSSGGTDITSALKGITLGLAALVEAMGGTSVSTMSESLPLQRGSRR